MNFTNQNLRWIDYSALSTIVGFESYTAKKIFYCRTAPKICLCQYYLNGVSNSVDTKFTLPLPAADDELGILLCGTSRSSATSSTIVPSAVYCNSNSGDVPSVWGLMYGVGAGGTWDNTDAKYCRGQFFFQTT